jgi:general secretion pathway protein H
MRSADWSSCRTEISAGPSRPELTCPAKRAGETPAAPAGEAGFSLIEVVAAMLIIALLSGLAVAMMPGTGRAQLKAVALETAALLRRERLGAVLTGRNRMVSLDGESRQFVGDGGDVVAIPRDVVVDVLGVDEQLAGRQTVVRFHPDGASSGAVLRLSRQGTAYEIRVNWYTGGVAVESR